jgi:putative membrane protein insertion efficiency factor
MIARLLVLLIRVYQRTLSPLLGNVCRFEPSCSRYAAACLEEHGAVRGSLLSIRRLCKCHPFHPGGYDPPPLKARPSSLPRLAPTSKGPIAPQVATNGAPCAHD